MKAPLYFFRKVQQSLPALLIGAIAVQALFSSDQGKDILRDAIDDPWLMTRLAIAASMVCIVGGICVSFLADFGEGEYRDLRLELQYGLILGFFGLFLVLVVLMPDYKDQAVWKVLQYIGIGTATLLGILQLSARGVYKLPPEGRPGWMVVISLVVLVVIAICPSQIGAACGVAIILGTITSAWLILVTALVMWCRARSIALLGAVVVGLVLFQTPPLLVMLGICWLAAFIYSRLQLDQHWIWGLLYGCALLAVGFGGLIGLAIISYYLPVGGRDMIRGEPRFQQRTSFGDFFKSWQSQPPSGKSTIVLVAAAGGGIRASYWTSLVLSRATERFPELPERMFLASGVSGGSLGLSVYRSLLTEPYRTALREERQPNCASFARCAAEFHSRDMLAGILAETLTGKIFNTILPFSPFPARSKALERAWESAWRDTMKSGDDFAKPFENLWSGPGPALVLNTTSSTGGDRLPISNLSTEWIQTQGPCKANIAEHLKLPLSAAANASARFPFLEDWGSFVPQPDPRDDKKPASPCQPHEAVADGGFVDNYGAATIDDALTVLNGMLDKSEVKPRPRIIVIQITSDPDCRIGDALDPDAGIGAGCEKAASERRKRTIGSQRETLLFNDPRGPDNPGVFGVLSNARTVSGLSVASRLRDRIVKEGGSYYQFSIAGAFDSPLGWSLSSSARRQLDGMLDDDGLNACNFERLIAELTNGGPAKPEKKCPPDTVQKPG